MFQQPRENTPVPISEMVGSLVIFKVIKYRTGINTSFGDDKDAVECDVHCLDGQHAGQVFRDGLIFQGALIGSLKGAAGSPEPVLGRIGVGDAKPKQNPPYLLLPFTQADAAIAGPYWERVQASQFQPPAPQPTTAVAPMQQHQPSPQPQYAPPAAAPAPQYQPQQQPVQAYQPAPAPAPAAAPAYQPAPAPAAPEPSEADKFLGYPGEVQLVLIQSGQAPALTQDQFATLSGDIQQALLKLQAAAV